MLIKNINAIRAAEITKNWLAKDRDNYVQITSSAFDNCYRLNLWCITKSGLRIIKSYYRITPD